jgi:quinol monooxygenase YgiN
MVKLALFVRLEAQAGKEAALEDFLAGALPLANAESGTTAWFALKFGPSTFGVFDAFADEAGRQAHLDGPIAAALMANAATLLSSPPTIQKVDLLAAKLPV